MHTTVTFNRSLPLFGINDKGLKTYFDASSELLGPGGSAASPMDTVLESLGACSMMDIISILKKMRRELIFMEADLDAQRAKEHPKVFTAIQISYRLKSPDCTHADFEKAVRLSMDNYCSVAAMIRGAGCVITWSTELVAVKSDVTERSA
ncbi:MAG: OsmC family peroxiredoxin [Chlorobiaceae bacterium]|nr:OsmC family peroxiredoxin [Chlorobiaceae bacterium]